MADDLHYYCSADRCGTGLLIAENLSRDFRVRKILWYQLSYRIDRERIKASLLLLCLNQNNSQLLIHVLSVMQLTADLKMRLFVSLISITVYSLSFWSGPYSGFDFFATGFSL